MKCTVKQYDPNTDELILRVRRMSQAEWKRLAEIANQAKEMTVYFKAVKEK